ncbi:MAG: MFS transporter, partial [Chloroflexi bacterium]|nr:MFS transporter [Chloroflexota bacterium]
MATLATSQPASRTEIARLLSAILASRFIINSAFRMGYAFAPELSRGLGVDLQAMSTLVGVRAGMGVFAPVFGTLSDRFGRRAVMLGGMALLVACALLAFFAPSLALFALGFVGLGLAKVVFEPSASAHLGDRVPYARRGFVMGM